MFQNPWDTTNAQHRIKEHQPYDGIEHDEQGRHPANAKPNNGQGDPSDA